MKLTLELTKKELYDYDIFYEASKQIADEYKNRQEFLDDLEAIINRIIRDAFEFSCEREIIIDGFYLNQFLTRNKTEITDFFKDEYGMIFTEDIEEADCCLNCAEVHDKKLNSEQKLWCSKFSRWVKPINHCKNWK